MTVQAQGDASVYRTQAAPRVSALAVVSLVCGVLGVFLPCVVASIVCGILARKEIERSNGAIGGAALAKIGLALSIFWMAIVCLVIAVAAVSAFTAGVHSAQSAQSAAVAEASENACVAHMRTLYAAIETYRMENDLRPSTLQTLVGAQVVPADTFSCGAAAGALDPANVDGTGAYAYDPAAGDLDPMVWEKAAAHGSGDTVHAMVLFGDGHIEAMAPDDINARIGAAG